MVIALDEKLKEYAEKFGQNVPVFFFRNKSESEIIALVKECLRQNKPFVVEDNSEDDI